MLKPQQVREIVDEFFGGRNAVSKEEAYRLAAKITMATTRASAKTVRAVTDRMFDFNRKDSS